MQKNSKFAGKTGVGNPTFPFKPILLEIVAKMNLNDTIHTIVQARGSLRDLRINELEAVISKVTVLNESFHALSTDVPTELADTYQLLINLLREWKTQVKQ